MRRPQPARRLPDAFGTRWEEAHEVYLEYFRAIHLARLRATVGAAELLVALTGTDLYLGVVSNKTGAMLRREVEYLGWTGHFHRLVGAGDAARDKPDPAPMRLALEGSGIALAEAWYVGDTALDMECARNSGCTGVLLGASVPVTESVSRFPPALRFRDCATLARHLRAL